jgi:hypothetical protein
MVAEFRNRGGYRRSTAITDAIATSFLNAGIAEVHDLICKHNPDFLVTSDDLVTEADEPLVELPADFYKLRRLDLVEGSTVTKLRPFQFEEEGRIADGTIWDDGVSMGRPRFMLQAGNLRLAPPPSSILALRLWYIPHATKLVLAEDPEDDTVYDGVNGHEDLVYEHALRMAKARDRMDTSVHDQAIARLEKRLLSALESRDQSEPEYLADHGRGGGW